MITAQQARGNAMMKVPTIEKLLENANKEIEGSSKRGYHYCKPFQIPIDYYKEIGIWNKEVEQAYYSNVKQAIKQLEQLGFSIHVPKTIIRRKPKYEETIIRW